MPTKPQPGKGTVLIISQYSFPENKRNMNMYQRVLYGSNHATIHLLLRRKARVSDEIQQAATVHHAPFQNRWLFLAYVVCFCICRRPPGCRVIFTEPSGLAAAGFLARRLARMTWVLDVWDRPRWRPGEHEEGQRRSWSDRLIFWMMRRADIYLLSVLPQAAKDINPPADRCVQLYNAIDKSVVAKIPPQRFHGKNEPLELAYGKSRFDRTLGLRLVLKAAEILKQRDCPVIIHIVGHLPDTEKRAIERSKAADYFRLHGFVKCTRTEFFAKVHVGLVSYLDYEDLSYIFPIKVLEHLSQGNPVVATRLPGLCAMVKHQENGLIVEPRDAEAMADAIEILQRDTCLFNRLAKSALESVRQFDIEAKHEKIFRAISGFQVERV